MKLSKTPVKPSKKGASHTKQQHKVNRIEGQVRGIGKMIEEQRYCIDILTQLKAIKSALTSLEQDIVEQHLNHCVHKAIKSKNSSEVEEMLKEINALLKKTTK